MLKHDDALNIEFNYDYDKAFTYLVLLGHQVASHIKLAANN